MNSIIEEMHAWKDSAIATQEDLEECRARLAAAEGERDDARAALESAWRFIGTLDAIDYGVWDDVVEGLKRSGSTVLAPTPSPLAAAGLDVEALIERATP